MELNDADNADTKDRLNDAALDNTKPGLAIKLAIPVYYVWFQEFRINKNQQEHL